MKPSLFLSFLFCPVLFSALNSEEIPLPASGFINPFLMPPHEMEAKKKNETACEKAPHPMRITLRHIEGKGIGYSQGYSSLDLFFARSCGLDDCWVPFLDLRGHIFDNGKPAANGGLGIRYVNRVVLGLNAYYDYRKTHKTHYNQVGGGFELLGTIFDFRINGFFPVGKKRSSLSDASFFGFKGHNLILSRKFEFAMTGANAEIGAHAKTKGPVGFYAAVGPYYLTNYGTKIWGGEGRIALDFSDYIKAEGFTSYDHVFKWIFQGQLSLNIPFGGRKRVTPKAGRSCRSQEALAQRAVQRVDRFEIIAVDNKKKKTVAINPATGMPYIFWFVDNTSSSNGTFESPFNNLIAAQNASAPYDIIYVFPGDGTTRGMNAGIVLKDVQKLLGSELDYIFPTQFGNITVPAQQAGIPSMTNASGSNAVILCASGNEIAGMKITVDNSRILAQGSNGLNFHNNQVLVLNNSGQKLAGLRLEGVTGQINVAQNNFMGLDTNGMFLLNIVSSGNISANANYLVTQNLFNSILPNSPTTGIELGEGTGGGTGGIPIGDINTLTISNNAFVNLGELGVSGKAIGGSGFAGVGTINIIQNLFNQDTSGAGNQIVLINSRNGHIKVNVANNLWQNTITPGSSVSLSLQVLSSTAAFICANVVNNISDSTGSAYNLNNISGGTLQVNLSNNVGTVTTFGTVTSGPCN